MRLFITALLMVLISISAWAGTFRDDFEDGNMDGWKYEIGQQHQWRIEDGEVILESNSSLTGFSMGEFSWTDYTVGVSVKLTKHQPVGGLSEMASLIVHGENVANIYMFGIGTLGLSARQAQAYYFKNGVTGGQKTGVFLWEIDTWHDLRVEVKGNRFEFFVDDGLVFEYINNLFPAGKAGFGIGNSVTAHFDDFFITGDNVPDIGPSGYAVEYAGKLTTTWGQIKAR